jgi:Tfp pilus assembly protein PilN
MSMNAEMQEKPKKKNTAQDLFARMGVLGELLAFFWKRKQFWLIPMIIVLLLVAVFIVIGIASPAGVFVYTLF